MIYICPGHLAHGAIIRSPYDWRTPESVLDVWTGACNLCDSTVLLYFVFVLGDLQLNALLSDRVRGMSVLSMKDLRSPSSPAPNKILCTTV